MANYKILALFGKSAAGKDTLQKTLVNAPINTNSIVSCTTRPPRENEIEGEDYHFLSVIDFTKKVLDGSMLEATCFRDWFYGTSIDSLKEDCLNVGVFNIAGIECLLTDPNIKVYPVQVEAFDKIRLLRSLQREQNPDCKEICRRFFTDEEDFNKTKIIPSFVFQNNSKEEFKTELNRLLNWLTEIDAFGQK